MDIRVKDSEHDVNVKTNDTKQTISVETTFDRILEICGIVTEDDTVVEYAEWTEEQDECINKLKQESINDQLDRLQEEETTEG